MRISVSKRCDTEGVQSSYKNRFVIKFAENSGLEPQPDTLRPIRLANDFCASQIYFPKCAAGRIRTYSTEVDDLQSSVTLQLHRIGNCIGSCACDTEGVFTQDCGRRRTRTPLNSSPRPCFQDKSRHSRHCFIFLLVRKDRLELPPSCSQSMPSTIELFPSVGRIQ